MYSSHTFLCISPAKGCRFLSCTGLWCWVTHSPSVTQGKFGGRAQISSSSSLLDSVICMSTQVPPILIYTAIAATFLTHSICWQPPLSFTEVSVCLHSQNQPEKVFSIREYLKKPKLFQELKVFIIASPSSSVCKSSVSRFMTHQDLHGLERQSPMSLKSLGIDLGRIEVMRSSTIPVSTQKCALAL